MSNAWETTVDDVLNVVHQMGRKLTAEEADELHGALDHFEIECEALRGNNMETQTEYAYVEIRRQLECLDEWKRIDESKGAKA